MAAQANTSASPRGHKPVGRPRALDSAQTSLAHLLNMVRTGMATTRQELERHSELGRATVVDRLAALAELGLIREGELGQTTGGRAPRQMQFRDDAGSILVSAIDQNSLAIGLADLNGTVLLQHHERSDLSDGPQALLDRLITTFAWQLEETERARPWGIGLAFPGMVPKASLPFAAVAPLENLPAWHDFPFVARLMQYFDAPVFARTGVQAMTLGESRAGSGRGASDLIFVKLGRSITAGVISDGRLHRGMQGAAGMIGHTRVEEELLETLAGADALEREAMKAAAEGRSAYLAQILARSGSLALSDIAHAAQIGDIASVEIFTRCGRLVGEALAPVTNLFNPGLIVVGGVVAEAGGDSLLAGLREAVYGLSHPVISRDLRILRSPMGASSGLVGAAQVVVETLFSPQILQGWISLGTPRRHPDFLATLASQDPPRQTPSRP